jgi:hypothetical protein
MSDEIPTVRPRGCSRRLPTALRCASTCRSRAARSRASQAIADLLRLDLRHGVGGVLEGALEVRARTSNEEIELAAAQAIARVIPDDELHADYIVPSVFNRRVAESVAEAVANAAVASGVARRERGAGTPEPATPLQALR